MQSHRPYDSTRRRFRALAALLALTCCGVSAHAQYVPIISGAAGFTSSTNGGNTTMSPILMPLAAVPIGHHLLVESRAFIQGSYAQVGRTGPYKGQLFTSLNFLQLDYTANSKMTFVAGRYIIPFGTYNERLTPIWIPNFQDAPSIFAIGTRTSGSGNGGQVRGVLYANDKIHVNYAAYVSANTTHSVEFKSGRTVGEQFSLVFPGKRLEVGSSYNRLLQGVQVSNIGAHLWWQPYRVPFSFRSEYARSAHSDGYWFETSYRYSQWRGPDSLLGRLETAFRMQQTFRHSPNTPGQADSLPAVGTQQADLGFDYHLPQEIRLNTSYSRFFSQSGNHNLWEISLTYRFLFPVWKGHVKK